MLCYFFSSYQTGWNDNYLLIQENSYDNLRLKQFSVKQKYFYVFLLVGLFNRIFLVYRYSREHGFKGCCIKATGRPQGDTVLDWTPASAGVVRWRGLSECPLPHSRESGNPVRQRGILIRGVI